MTNYVQGALAAAKLAGGFAVTNTVVRAGCNYFGREVIALNYSGMALAGAMNGVATSVADKLRLYIPYFSKKNSLVTFGARALALGIAPGVAFLTGRASLAFNLAKVAGLDLATLYLFNFLEKAMSKLASKSASAERDPSKLASTSAGVDPSNFPPNSDQIE